jgi:hypothetical protein
MMPSRGMGDINSSKMPKARTITRKRCAMIQKTEVTVFKAGGKSRVNEAGNYTKPGGGVKLTKRFTKGGETKSRVNEAGNYTKPGMRKALFERIKAGGKGGAPGQWSARKAQMLAQQYKKAGGGYKD